MEGARPAEVSLISLGVFLGLYLGYFYRPWWQRRIATNPPMISCSQHLGHDRAFHVAVAGNPARKPSSHRSCAESHASFPGCILCCAGGCQHTDLRHTPCEFSGYVVWVRAYELILSKIFGRLFLVASRRMLSTCYCGPVVCLTLKSTTGRCRQSTPAQTRAPMPVWRNASRFSSHPTATPRTT